MPERPHRDEAGAATATADAAALLAGELGAEPTAVRDHLARLPDRYAAWVSPRAVVRHTLMAATPPTATEVRTRVTPGEPAAVDPAAPAGDAAPPEAPDELEQLDELDVVAPDHPGWFAKVAGVLALHGGSVVAAHAFTRDDGLAIDTFRVRRPRDATASWWARVEGDLADAAAGRLALRARVLREARRQRPVGIVPVPTGLSVSTDPTGRATVVEVRTEDRLGVLYAIASALAELELDLVVARAETAGREVVDAFTVRDRLGRALEPDHVAELELAVPAAIAELSVLPAPEATVPAH